MKKVALLALGLVLTLISYSQSFYKIVISSKSEFKNEKWVNVGTKRPVDEFVIVNETNITIGTYKFKVYGDYEKTEYEKHTTYTWKCINGEGGKCYFMMKLFKPEVTKNVLYSIIYDSGVMYEYETEE